MVSVFKGIWLHSCSMSLRHFMRGLNRGLHCICGLHCRNREGRQGGSLTIAAKKLDCLIILWPWLFPRRCPIIRAITTPCSAAPFGNCLTSPPMTTAPCNFDRMRCGGIGVRKRPHRSRVFFFPFSSVAGFLVPRLRLPGPQHRLDQVHRRSAV